jgi:hypothetical protein
MRFDAARGAALVLAFVVAGSGVQSCACAEMKARTADTTGGHCAPAEAGVRVTPESCACVCMTAHRETSATVRVELVLSPTMSVVPSGQGVIPGSCRLLAPIPLRSLGHSPPSSSPSILRI